MSDYIHSGSNKMNKVGAYTNENKILLADKLGHAKVSSLKEENLINTINTVATHDTDITQLKTDMNQVRGAYVYKGTVETEYDLPLTNNHVGDVYNTSSTGINYAWNGESWDELGSNDVNLVHRTGNENINNQKIFTEGPYGTANAVTTSELNLSNGCVFTKTITANTTFIITGVPISKVATFNLLLTNGGAYIVTWPASVKWAEGIPPDLTVSGIDVLTFLTPDGGVTWYGTIALAGAA